MREEHHFGCIIKLKVNVALKLLNKQDIMDLLNQKEHGGQQSMEKVLIEINGQDTFSPMKYNRIVIFRTDLWHSHNYNFGDNLENGRLVQLFFFNPTDWDK